MTAPHARAAFSFLEAVAAIALLGLVAAALLSLLGFVSSAQARQAQQLAAAELANRLLLMYLDDPTAMPPGIDPIAYGPHFYRWQIDEQPLVLTEARPRPANRTVSPLDNNRYVQVTVRVWLSERSGGSHHPSPDTLAVSLSRMLDPIALRNPDSGENLLNNPQRMQEYMSRMMGVRSAPSSSAPRR